MPITHTFVSAIPDDPAAAAAGDVLTQSHWNADHSGDHDPVTVGTGLDVTGQLVELDLSEVAAGGELAGFLNAPTVDATHSGSTHSASTDTHIADASDAHDASAISFTPNGSIAATDVQAAIQEVRDEAGGLPAGGTQGDPLIKVSGSDGDADWNATGVVATLTTALTGANNDLIFTSLVGGEFGNAIQVEYVDPGAPDALLAIEVIGARFSKITVNLATGPGGAITSTAQEVLDALLGDAETIELVTIALAPANDGTGVVTALALTNLAGGLSALRVAGPIMLGTVGDTNVIIAAPKGGADQDGTDLIFAAGDAGDENEAGGDIRFIAGGNTFPDGTGGSISFRPRAGDTDGKTRFFDSDGELSMEVSEDVTIHAGLVVLEGFDAGGSNVVVTDAGDFSAGASVRLSALSTTDPAVSSEVWSNGGVLTLSGSTLQIVTVQTGAPGGSYVTPLIYDDTAVTGGLYAWDGAAYAKVGGLA